MFSDDEIHDHNKDVKLLGTIGTFIYYHRNMSTLIVSHSNTPYLETIKKKKM